MRLFFNLASLPSDAELHVFGCTPESAISMDKDIRAKSVFHMHVACILFRQYFLVSLLMFYLVYCYHIRDERATIIDWMLAFWVGRIDSEASPDCKFVIMSPVKTLEGFYVWMGRRSLSGIY